MKRKRSWGDALCRAAIVAMSLAPFAACKGGKIEVPHQSGLISRGACHASADTAPRRVIQSQPTSVSAEAVSPSGMLLATADGTDNSIRIWNARQHVLLKTIARAHATFAMEWADEAELVTVGLESGGEGTRLTPPEALRIDGREPTSPLMPVVSELALTDGGATKVGLVDAYESLQSRFGSGHSVDTRYSVIWSRDSEGPASRAKPEIRCDIPRRIDDPEGADQTASRREHSADTYRRRSTRAIEHLAAARRGHLVALAAHKPERVLLFDGDPAACSLRTIEVTDGAIASLAVTPTGDRVAAILTSGTATRALVLDARGTTRARLDLDSVRKSKRTADAAWSADGKLLAITTGDDVEVWDVEGRGRRLWSRPAKAERIDWSATDVLVFDREGMIARDGRNGRVVGRFGPHQVAGGRVDFLSSDSLLTRKDEAGLPPTVWHFPRAERQELLHDRFARLHVSLDGVPYETLERPDGCSTLQELDASFARTKTHPPVCPKVVYEQVNFTAGVAFCDRSLRSE